jgi:hypothetical protein
MKALFLSLVCFLFIVNALRAQEMPGDLTKKQISDALEHARRAQEPLSNENMERITREALRDSEGMKFLRREQESSWWTPLRYALWPLVVLGISGAAAILRQWREEKQFIRAREREEAWNVEAVREDRPDGNRRRGEQGVYGIGPDGKVWMRGDGFIFRPSEASGVEQASMSPGQPKPEADDKPDAGGGFDWSSLKR